MQKEKEVLALLSRLDLENVHFTDSPPGMLPNLFCLSLCSFIFNSLWFLFLLGHALEMFRVS